jgi:hypothetical protein
MRELTLAGRRSAVVALVLAGSLALVTVAAAKPAGQPQHTWPCARSAGKVPVHVCHKRQGPYSGSRQPGGEGVRSGSGAGEAATFLVAVSGILVLVLAVGAGTLLTARSRRATAEPQP